MFFFHLPFLKADNITDVEYCHTVTNYGRQCSMHASSSWSQSEASQGSWWRTAEGSFGKLQSVIFGLESHLPCYLRVLWIDPRTHKVVDKLIFTGTYLLLLIFRAYLF